MPDIVNYYYCDSRPVECSFVWKGTLHHVTVLSDYAKKPNVEVKNMFNRSFFVHFPIPTLVSDSIVLTTGMKLDTWINKLTFYAKSITKV